MQTCLNTSATNPQAKFTLLPDIQHLSELPLGPMLKLLEFYEEQKPLMMVLDRLASGDDVLFADFIADLIPGVGIDAETRWMIATEVAKVFVAGYLAAKMERCTSRGVH